MPSLAPEYEVNTNTPAETTQRTGLTLPLSQNTFGGLARVNGSDNDTKMITLALMSTESENPFQQPTDNIEALMFEMADGAAFAVVRRKLEQVFADFERQNRYRLLPETITYERDEEGEVTAHFKFHNLEADQIQNMSTSLGPS